MGSSMQRIGDHACIQQLLKAVSSFLGRKMPPVHGTAAEMGTQAQVQQRENRNGSQVDTLLYSALLRTSWQLQASRARTRTDLGPTYARVHRLLGAQASVTMAGPAVQEFVTFTAQSFARARFYARGHAGAPLPHAVLAR